MRTSGLSLGVLLGALAFVAPAQATISRLDRPNERVLAPTAGVATSGIVTVAWEQLNLTTDRTEVMARRVAANGTLGTAVVLSTDQLDNNEAPQVAVDGAGDAIVVWTVDGTTVTTAVGAQWPAASATPNPPHTLSVTSSSVIGLAPSIAMGTDTATIVWEQSDSGGFDAAGDHANVYGVQWLASSAAPAALTATQLSAGAEFAVEPAVAMGATFATIAWLNATTDAVEGVRWTAGSAAGTEQAVSVAADKPSIASAGDPGASIAVGASTTGNAFVAWTASPGANQILKATNWPSAATTPSATHTTVSQASDTTAGPEVVTVATSGNATFAWRGAGADGTLDVREQTLSAGALGTEHILAGSPEHNPSGAIDFSNDALGPFPQAVTTPAGITTILYGIGGSVSRLRGVRIAADGTVGSAFVLGGPYEYMDLAQDPGGDTVLVWDHIMECDGDIRESRWASGATTTPSSTSITVSILEDAVENPTVAENASGAGAMAYVHCAGGSARAEARLWPAGADPGAAIALSSGATTDASSPVVGVDASGTTTAVWTQITASGDQVIKGVRISPTGTLGAVQTLSSTSFDSAGAVLQVTPSGAAVVLWDQYDGIQHETVFGARWPAGMATAPLAAMRISPNDSGSADPDDMQPVLAVDPAGDAIVAWSPQHLIGSDLAVFGSASIGFTIGVEAVRWAANGTLGTVSPVAGSALVPAVAIDPAGEAHVAWFGSSSSEVEDWAPGASAPGAPSALVGAVPVLATDAAGDTFVAAEDGVGADVDLQVRAAGAASFSTAADLSSPGAFEQALAVDAAGDSVVADRVTTTFNVNEPIEARVRLADGSVCSEQTIGQIGFSGSLPSVAIDSTGTAEAAWVEWDGAGDELKWARFGPDCPVPQPPASPPPPGTAPPQLTTPATPLAPPTPPAKTVKAQSLATILGLPSTKSCVSRRTVTIHVPVHISVKGKKVTLTKAEILLSGKIVKRLSGKNLTATISLKGLKKGTFTVTIRATTSTHTTLSATAHYKTCATKKTTKPKPKPKKHR
jgi:hypothetical protein